MRNIWHDIDPRCVTPEKFTAVIEIPAGSKKKYELDKQTRPAAAGSHSVYLHALSGQLRFYPAHLRG